MNFCFSQKKRKYLSIKFDNQKFSKTHISKKKFFFLLKLTGPGSPKVGIPGLGLVSRLCKEAISDPGPGWARWGPRQVGPGPKICSPGFYKKKIEFQILVPSPLHLISMGFTKLPELFGVRRRLIGMILPEPCLLAKNWQKVNWQDSLWCQNFSKI